jgi:hypothetical protein
MSTGQSYRKTFMHQQEETSSWYHANLDKAAGSEDEDLYAVIWNPGD